jgi:hypothetical protein
MRSSERAPIRPDRVRGIAGESFAAVPHRFLRDGYLASLGTRELALYFFLVLAGDRRGISFYGYDAICSVLEFTLDEYIEARNDLIRRDLIAFDGRRFQVLSLPAAPALAPAARPCTDADIEERDPASIRRACLDALGLPHDTPRSRHR